MENTSLALIVGLLKICIFKAYPVHIFVNQSINQICSLLMTSCKLIVSWNYVICTDNAIPHVYLFKTGNIFLTTSVKAHTIACMLSCCLMSIDSNILLSSGKNNIISKYAHDNSIYILYNYTFYIL